MFRFTSARESPPNLRSASSASTRATIVSATTPMAGTAGTSVRSLNDTVSSLVTTSTVGGTGFVSGARGGDRLVERRQRLHADAGRQQLAGRHPTFDTTGERRLARVRRRCRVPVDRIVGLRPAATGDLEAVTDLDALDRLDRHQGAGEQRVELAVPVHV